jgi:Large polyvalent protein-associated domain 7
MDNQDSPFKDLSQKQKQELHKIYTNLSDIDADRDKQVIIMENALRLTGTAASPEATKESGEALTKARLAIAKGDANEASIMSRLSPRPDLLKPLSALRELDAKANAGDISAGRLLFKSRDELSEAVAAKGASKRGEASETENAISPAPIQDRSAERLADAPISAGVSLSQEEPVLLKKRKKLDPILQDAAASILLPRLVLDRYSVRGKDIVDKEDPKRIIFTDKGDKLTTKRDATAESVRAMLDTAESRGWNSIKVTGSKEFRRQAYLEAGARGLAIQGYEPSKEEKEFVDLQAEKNKKLNTMQSNPAADRFLKAETKQERTAAALQHPELTKAFALEASFKRFAEQTLAPQHRDAFVQRQRLNIADDLNSGKELPEIQFRQNATKERHQDQGATR